VNDGLEGLSVQVTFDRLIRPAGTKNYRQGAEVTLSLLGCKWKNIPGIQGLTIPGENDTKSTKATDSLLLL